MPRYHYDDSPVLVTGDCCRNLIRLEMVIVVFTHRRKRWLDE
jgi:hypothetical protein